MSHGKQFTLYTNVSGSNGWYIWLLTRSLEQLTEVVVAGSGHQESCYRSGGIGIDLRIHLFDFEKGEHKAPDYLRINPNGQIPALVDHRDNDFVVWSVASFTTAYNAHSPGTHDTGNPSQ